MSAEDIVELADRLERWCMNTGFNGNPDCPPMRAIVALRFLLPLRPGFAPQGEHECEVSK